MEEIHRGSSSLVRFRQRFEFSGKSSSSGQQIPIKDPHQAPVEEQLRSCLVVLDDIWSSDAWESIKDGFPIKLKGSKVLITTRNREVAIVVDSFIHEPRLLNIEESWELLRKRAHQEKCTEEFEKIVELGKEMVTHCGGLPLAVVVLGGILSSKHSYTEGMVSIEDRIGDDETMMDIAERYLGELVERCLVFVEQEEVTFFRRFKSCHLRDLMRDMC
ncbi:antimicrobial response protein [Lithospermum erythrorhizon]|uniref:Antimicrobial response protein n=1 Tax=Lithospermum erythrorhizon TaxID=34254 RepID=A0AAV3RB35_LITER